MGFCGELQTLATLKNRKVSNEPLAPTAWGMGGFQSQSGCFGNEESLTSH